jgi:hypothetical protein
MPMADRMEDTGRRYSQLHASTSTMAQVDVQFDLKGGFLGRDE